MDNNQNNNQSIDLLTPNIQNTPQPVPMNQPIQTNYQQPVDLLQPTNQNQMNQPKKNNKFTLLIIALVAIILVLLIVLFSDNDSEDKSNNTTTTTTKETTTSTTSTNTTTTTTKAINTSTNLSINQAIVNGITISLPATNASFDGTGWLWDNEYSERELKTGYTTSGGRIGEYPGGVVVSVYNDSGETKKVKDCIIDMATFYNPKDGSNDVTFINGINFSFNEEQVKNAMIKAGYQVVEHDYEDSSYLKYYKDNDETKYKSYIEFYFYDGVIGFVTIRNE